MIFLCRSSAEKRSPVPSTPSALPTRRINWVHSFHFVPPRHSQKCFAVSPAARRRSGQRSPVPSILIIPQHPHLPHVNWVSFFIPPRRSSLDLNVSKSLCRSSAEKRSPVPSALSTRRINWVHSFVPPRHSQKCFAVSPAARRRSGQRSPVPSRFFISRFQALRPTS